jgi:hypothetical protein
VFDGHERTYDGRPKNVHPTSDDFIMPKTRNMNKEMNEATRAMAPIQPTGTTHFRFQPHQFLSGSCVQLGILDLYRLVFAISFGQFTV